MNQSKIEKDLCFLKVYAGTMTIACAVCFGLIFKMSNGTKFQEISVERINVVESDGKLRMVISNKARQHPGIVDGVTFDERIGKRHAGMIFFGENGNEVGGLVFDSNKEGQGGSITFDKFRGDQTLQFLHAEDKDENYFAGVKMNDQPTPATILREKQMEIDKLPTEEAKNAAYKDLRDKGMLMTERLKIGRDFDKSSVIKLKDAKGNVRIELKVEASGEAKLAFLDEQGKVTYSLPENRK